MSKFHCVCGNLIRISGLIPNPDEWKIISDIDFDHFEGLVDAENVYASSTSMFRCRNCGCLWVYWDGFDNPPQLYTPSCPSLARAAQRSYLDKIERRAGSADPLLTL
ncbi:hypothetical protein [Sphaerisporangium sp. NPDC051011]|uniref:hypothetical protein n=1 Tax=Sphaerisporangium sp. NPDC051011 TaxID=3155792 RepID=UPI00340CEB1B